MSDKGSWWSKILLVIGLSGIGYEGWQHFFAPPKITIQKIAAPPLQQLSDVPREPFSSEAMIIFQRLKLLHTTGDFQGALKFAQDTLAGPLTDVAFREWLTRQLGPLFTAAGWIKLKSGDCDEANKLFYSAVHFGAVPETHKGLGACMHSQHNWPEAASWLANFIVERPQDIDARILYADALESLGRFDEAVKALEGALESSELGDRRVSVNTRLQAMHTKAREGSRQRSEYSRRFFVSYREDEHDRLISSVFETLESAADEFSDLTGIALPDAPIEVVLYRREAFRDVLPGGPQWSEGVFDGRIRVPIAPEAIADPRGMLAVILRHELSHALLAARSAGRPWPTWFDEGLAQYLSCRGRTCQDFTFGSTPGVFSELRLLTEPFVTLSAIDAGRAYAHSLYLVRMMVSGRGEDVIKATLRDVPNQVAITSDGIAGSNGFKDFDDWVTKAKALWARREKL